MGELDLVVSDLTLEIPDHDVEFLEMVPIVGELLLETERLLKPSDDMGMDDPNRHDDGLATAAPNLDLAGFRMNVHFVHLGRPGTDHPTHARQPREAAAERTGAHPERVEDGVFVVVAHAEQVPQGRGHLLQHVGELVRSVVDLAAKRARCLVGV
ncbi:MAG: hypothetical protein A3A24_00015 [Candidatus Buchananbacteria bacterium RIFCSPLOWO2_01_FULL_46_12]|uniref:Uncharacterized protein n=2 Tax=Candidatus Buchananiibacteriota TaxID=1817903 RepID=A0A1G1YQ68_9BACT|nr:MAG: hypothetical protein A2744_00995 [Candidatus Buchananbacteria bacterium RIFCSPHIGHO2_01_FULL_44_11]OGY53966.1 MAG: hypothetical protein A3A24_00015 [Candidatus Buchananbacteria bacterium RIFCSPLOWO2_01_FULL_46_12]